MGAQFELPEGTALMPSAHAKNPVAPVKGETFGRRMARLRKHAGYSQVGFAKEIGISPRMVAYYEVQTDRPPAHLLAVIAKALGVSADQLLGLEEVPKRKPPINQQLLRTLKKIETLPPRDQGPLLRMIEGYIQTAGNGKAGSG